MSLENCKECRRTISDKAYSCPNCGAHDPFNKGFRFLKGLFITLGVILLALILFVYSLGF